MTLAADEPSDDAWRNVHEFYAALERDREQHGPRVCELRCAATVLRYLTLKLPVSDREPWEPAPLLGIPVIEDGDVPARCLRRVYNDGTSGDVEVISEATESILNGLDEPLKIDQPLPNWASIYRYGAIAPPPTSSILGILGGLGT